MNKKYFSALFLLSAIICLAIALPASAENSTSTKKVATPKSLVSGVVASVSGNTLFVSSNKAIGSNPATTTYTVDTTKAKIIQNSKSIAISDIKNGINVIVQGDLEGTTISASLVVVQNKVTDGSKTGVNNGLKLGFFARIGQWFSNLFK